jgi:hypothetical protein
VVLPLLRGAAAGAPSPLSLRSPTPGHDGTGWPGSPFRCADVMGYLLD